MEHISAQAVLVIHARIIDATGGSHGVRYVGHIESAVSAPKQSFGGEAVYTDLFTKAAVLFKKLASYHPFVDGNKRTAVATAARFLYKNGYELSVSQEDMVAFTVRVVEDGLEVDAIAEWLEENSRMQK
jgi:death-on-curing protein